MGGSSACGSLYVRACVQLADLPLSTGVGGFLLARASCEMLCEAMAAAWAAGRAAPVRRLMLLPQGGNSARVVSRGGGRCHVLGILYPSHSLFYNPSVAWHLTGSSQCCARA